MRSVRFQQIDFEQFVEIFVSGLQLTLIEN